MCLSLQVVFVWKDPLLVCVMFSECMLVGTLDGIDPTTKCHWEKSC